MTDASPSLLRAEVAGAETVLRQHLVHEEEQLDRLARLGGAWRARFQQRKQLRQLRQALKWCETRQMGRDAFIVKRGILTEAVLTGSATLLGFLFHPWVRDPQGMVDFFVVTLVLGGLAGLFGSVALWDREEANLTECLAGEFAIEVPEKA